MEVPDNAPAVAGYKRFRSDAVTRIASDDIDVETANGIFKVFGGQPIPPTLVEAYKAAGGKIAGENRGTPQPPVVQSEAEVPPTPTASPDPLGPPTEGQTEPPEAVAETVAQADAEAAAKAAAEVEAEEKAQAEADAKAAAEAEEAKAAEEKAETDKLAAEKAAAEAKADKPGGKAKAK
jgi:hypothetical protein